MSPKMNFPDEGYRHSQFVRLMFELEARDMITDYSKFHSGLAMTDVDRKKIGRRLGVDYPFFKTYRKEVLRLSYKTCKVCYKMGLNKSKLHLINYPWKISILEGYERKMPESMIAAVRNIPGPPKPEKDEED
jgi:hypothetical protein